MDEHDDLQARLRHLGTQAVDPAQQSADLTAMARVRPATSLRSKTRLAAAFLAGLLLGSTGLAAADALPDPAQHVAHTVLGHVGVDVPNPTRYHGAECGPDVKANHGAYVRDDHSLAKSDCGKPDHADKAGDAGRPADDGLDAAVGDGCHGKPPWAGNKSMTAEAKAAAQAERTARCGADDGAADEVDPGAEVPEAGEQKADDEASTTTTVASTTTEAATTTESTTSTTAP
jgi:hypothetical protein